MKSLILYFLCVFSFLGITKQTSYLSFEEPPGWTCQLSQGVYLCESPNEKERKNSLIMIFGAPMTEFDSLSNYENYLKKTKTILDDYKEPIQSKVTFVRNREINGFTWVDSLQQNSELAGYWTRYVATVQNPLAILVTYVVSNEKYVELTPSFERMVSSLKPVTDFKFATNQKDLALPGTELGGILKSRLSKKPEPKKESEPVVLSKDSSSMGSVIFLLLLGVGIVFYIRLRKKQTKNPSE